GTGRRVPAYCVGFVLALAITGMLSEHYGRRRVFIGSLVVFTTASLLCGLAGDIYTLIALRALQAAGGAGFTPSATGLVVDYFGEARDRMVGLFGRDRKSTRLNSSHVKISYAVFCLKKKKKKDKRA